MLERLRSLSDNEKTHKCKCQWRYKHGDVGGSHLWERLLDKCEQLSRTLTRNELNERYSTRGAQVLVGLCVLNMMLCSY